MWSECAPDRVEWLFQPHEDSACGGSCLCTVAAKRYCVQWGTACRNYLLDTQCKHYPPLSSCSSTAIHDVHEASGTSHSDVSPSFSSSASEHYFGALMLCVTMDGRGRSGVQHSSQTTLIRHKQVYHLQMGTSTRRGRRRSIQRQKHGMFGQGKGTEHLRTCREFVVPTSRKPGKHMQRDARKRSREISDPRSLLPNVT